MTDEANSITGAPESDIRCGQCGSGHLSKSIHDDVFTYGKDADAVELSVPVPVYICRHCGFSFTTEIAERLRHDAICAHLGVLTPEEVRKVRAQTGMTRERFASLTGIGTASLARWETGELIQGTGYDTYLRLLLYPENIERLLRGSTSGGNKALTPVAPLRDKDTRGRFKALVAAGRYDERVVDASFFCLRRASLSRPH
jgi:DNA-binding transcriptional regulator YiaG